MRSSSKDSVLARCVGNLLYLYSNLPDANNSVRNMTFDRNYAMLTLVQIYTRNTLNLTECTFTDNQSRNTILDGIFTAVLAGKFRNNKVMGNSSLYTFWLRPPSGE